MELRAFGNTGMMVSPLGFGVMRLPMKDGGKTVNSNTIDQVDVDIDCDDPCGHRRRSQLFRHGLQLCKRLFGTNIGRCL